MSKSKAIIAKCPECNNEILYKGQAKRPRITCNKCKKQFYIRAQVAQKPKSKKIDQGHLGVSGHSPIIDFIDDPDELLMSVAVRELNRPNPDSRWATILIACRKEKITNKNEVLDQFKQLSTQALVNLLSKSLQAE